MINNEQVTESRAPRAFGFWLVVFAGFLAASQVVRAVILQSDLPVFYNDQFAFSLNLPLPITFALYLFAMYFILRHLIRHWAELPPFTKLGFTAIVAGGVSNIGERLVYGSVADYVYLGSGVLNLADFYILFGIVLIFINYRRAGASS